MTEEPAQETHTDASRFPGGNGLGELSWEREAREYYSTMIAYREQADDQVVATPLEADTAATVWFSAVVAIVNSEIIGPLCQEFLGEHFWEKNNSLRMLASVVTDNIPEEESEGEVDE